MNEVVKKRFGKKPTLWSSSEGTVSQTELQKICIKAMNDGYTISVGDVTYTKVTNGN